VEGPGPPEPWAAEPPPCDPPSSAAPAEDSPVLRHAGGLYHLRQFAGCAEFLQQALAETPTLKGGHRLLGMALGRLGESRDAAAALARAIQEEPDEPVLRASLATSQMAAGVLPEPPIGPLEGPAGEIAGAVAWLWGQQSLRDGRPGEATRHFAEAAEYFARSSSPAELGERIGACYVGQAVSALLAGQLDAAQQAYTRLARMAPVREPVLALARQVYEVAEAVRELSPGERSEVLAPLADLILTVRLRVRFYDGEQPVAMHWEYS
jgi:tetratricopeptide (TPR) repeat protein